jgi:hypothetical protein
MTKSAKQHEYGRVETLQRRSSYLRERVNANLSPGTLNYYQQELSALEWAIPILEDYLTMKSLSTMDPETVKAVQHQLPAHVVKFIRSQS